MLSEFFMVSMLLLAVCAIGLGVWQDWSVHCVKSHELLGSSQQRESVFAVNQWLWCLAVVVPLVGFLFLI